jgi:leucyl-tRNA synthetase
MNYGTGAIMAVPAHDERDYEFAEKFGLEVKQVIKPLDSNINPKLYCGEGILVNSGPFDKSSTEQAREKISLYVGAKKKINFKIRD